MHNRKRLNWTVQDKERTPLPEKGKNRSPPSSESSKFGGTRARACVCVLMHREAFVECVRVVAGKAARGSQDLIWKGMCALCCWTLSFRQTDFIRNVSTGA